MAAILFFAKRHGLLFLLTSCIEQHTLPQKMADDTAGQEEQLTAAEVRAHYFTAWHTLEYFEVKCVTGEASEQLGLHSVVFLVVGHPYRVVSVWSLCISLTYKQWYIKHLMQLNRPF